MTKIYLLGTGYAVPEVGHDNTHFFVQHGSRGILVDCSTNPLPGLQRAGIALDTISDVILTHFHPDHASGLPVLLMSMWLLGRKLPVTIYANAHALERAQALMDMFDWKNWPHFYPTRFVTVSDELRSELINDAALKVVASPVRHLIPNIGLRFEFLPQRRSLAYSSDGEPSQAVVDLADRVDLMLHEAAGPSVGHSSPQQAGETAQQAGAKKLYLIHTTPRQELYAGMVQQAAQAFGGEVHMALDGMVLEL